MNHVKIDGTTKTLCIFGHPVAHSKSPLMHNALFKHLGINAAYLPYAPEPVNLKEAIAGFRAMGFYGANVTIPFKTDVINFVDELSDISKFTGSVNTLYWKDGIVGGTLCGTTTDPYGCIFNMQEFGVTPQKRNIAMLGNGGAAKAIAYALVENQNILTIVCRTKEKGEDISKKLNTLFKDKAPKVSVISFDEFQNFSDSFEIVLNATSVGMTPNENESPLPKEALNKNMIVADIIYAPLNTKLLQFAKDVGCKVVTGEGMLVHQGIQSFRKWFFSQTKDISNSELANIMRKGMQI